MQNLTNQSNIWSIHESIDNLIPHFASDAYKKLLPYVTVFLCSAHPYRENHTPMCPFVPQALKNHKIYFTYFNGEQISDSIAFIKECIDFYLNSKKYARSFGAVIILFPENYDIETLLKIQDANKVQCVDNALMLGALYNSSNAPSLHNTEYYPLRTPTPILVLRDMVINDLMFLDQDRHQMQKKIKFLTSFIKTFRNNTHNVERRQVQSAKYLRKKYLLKIYMSHISYVFIFSIIVIYLYYKIM
ncbi:MAG: hypothetical protein K2Y14_08660 [Burkholderiales bacterium]|nr:hypothetical protein [Burkholderiales bacterium]